MTTQKIEKHLSRKLFLNNPYQMTMLAIFIMLLPLYHLHIYKLISVTSIFVILSLFCMIFIFIFFSPKNTKTSVPKSDQYRYVVQENGKSNVTITVPAKQVWYVYRNNKKRKQQYFAYLVLFTTFQI